MERRKLLVTTGAVVSAGCIGPFANDGNGETDGNGDGEPSRDVDETAEEAIARFIDALNAGDTESVNGMLHPEGRLDEVPEQEGERLADSEISIESTEVVEEEEERAVVRVTLVAVSPEGEETTTEEDWELRVLDGEWRVWDGNIGAD